MPAEVGNNVLAAFSAVGSVFSVTVAVIAYFTKRGKDAGVSEASLATLKIRADQHESAIEALRGSVGDLNGAVAVLKDISVRAEKDGSNQNEKLDKLLSQISEMRGTMRARTHRRRGDS